jgi:penicillin-insensitive murein endopeptidase
MRLSRNRHWGHPQLVAYVERVAKKISKATGWPGILVGDMSQPRGGPMSSGHTSHQVGLDVDLWLTPMPNRELTAEERENTSAENYVSGDWMDVDRSKWTPAHTKMIETAVKDPAVDRALINAAIKKEICRTTKDRGWLRKLRAWYAHHDHIHVRLPCPAGMAGCRDQDPLPAGDGCDDLDYWFSDAVLKAKPKRALPPFMVAQLPAACRQVLTSP